MNKPTPKLHEKACRLFLTGEMTSTAKIAAAVKLPTHTVARWRRDGTWDELKRRIPQRAAEMLRQRLMATDEQRNARDRLIWGLILCQAGILLARSRVSPEELSILERIVASALRGMALTRTDGRQAS